VSAPIVTIKFLLTILTLSNPVTKLFESVILDKFQSSSDIDAYQFDLKQATLQHNVRVKNALLILPTES